MNSKLIALGLVSALALGACGGTDNTTTTTDNMGMASPMPMDNGDMGNAMLSGTPATGGQAFADTAAASDAYEIEAGKLAQEKATSQALKDFGKMMVEAHSTTTEKLKALAAQTDPEITPNPALNAEQEANLKTLRDATGAEFDTAYKSQQIMAHEKTLAALKDYAANGDVPQFKTFASETTGAVQMHLDKIKSM